MTRPVRIGCSGWNYQSWRETFYPPRVPARRWLEHYATQFDTVEVNATFYRLASPSAVDGWVHHTPPEFVFAVKSSRYLTHMKRLRDMDRGVGRFYESIAPLAESPKLGPVLWQLPPRLRFDADRVTAFLELLPHTTTGAAELAGRHDERLDGRALTRADAERPLRHAIEVRHESFRDPAFAALLREHDVALVLADSAGTWPVFDEVTSGFVYVRLHGQDELYAGGYTPEALDGWARRARAWRDAGLDVYVYFDNDAKVHAPYDAIALAARLNGLDAGRHPPAPMISTWAPGDVSHTPPRAEASITAGVDPAPAERNAAASRGCGPGPRTVRSVRSPGPRCPVRTGR
jgi:uncharacterized protein YecE (DUF72 family)